MSSNNAVVLLLSILALFALIISVELGVIYQRMPGPATVEQPVTTAPRATLAPPTKPAASDTRDECWDAMALMERWCTTDRWFDSCWNMMTSVQSLLRLGNKTAIFAELAKLEPQTGPISVWAADQALEDSDSHLNLDVNGVVDYFNNTAYFYTYRMHRLSVECGGWSVSYWKDPSPNVTRAIQLAYCELSPTDIRVCGAFDVIVHPE